MPSTGRPSANPAWGALSVLSSYTLAWLPDRITPLSEPSWAYARSHSSLTSQGCTSQYTWASRTRRAMSWVSCEPKSRIRIFWCCMVQADQAGIRRGDQSAREFGASLVICTSCTWLSRMPAAGISTNSARWFIFSILAQPQQPMAAGPAPAAGHLVDDGNHRALVGHAAFYAFGHQFVGIGVAGARLLEVAVGAAL